jgi:VIT1/CCC1 family predicted Fe2+/Mn2+ transporter
LKLPKKLNMKKEITPEATELTIENYLDKHFIHRSNWLRAAVLGANDGIISISSLAIGVSAASVTRDPILLASLAGLVAGALSMAAGEYVSVSSQTDIEKSDIEREAQELKEMPEEELKILAKIYENRGLSKQTAMQVALELTESDALAAHVRDELGITEMSQANPIQAALASGAAFTVGGMLPFLVTVFAPLPYMEYSLYGFTILSLIVLGTVAAKTGGSNVKKAILRIVVWGTIAMGLSALVGYLFGVNV